MPELIELRWAGEADAEALAAIFRAAWANAYAGIIPGPTLARMVSRRGPAWWRAILRAGERLLVLDLGSGPVGYARIGGSRRRSPTTGEIYELYLLPECQGIGLGRRLFEEARRRLAALGRPRVVVWALEENAGACRFYAALGGTPFGRGRERIGGRVLDKVGYVWV